MARSFFSAVDMTRCNALCSSCQRAVGFLAVGTRMDSGASSVVSAKGERSSAKQEARQWPETSSDGRRSERKWGPMDSDSEDENPDIQVQEWTPEKNLEPLTTLTFICRRNSGAGSSSAPYKAPKSRSRRRARR